MLDEFYKNAPIPTSEIIRKDGNFTIVSMYNPRVRLESWVHGWPKHCWDNFCVQWILVWWAAVVGRA